ncbi:MAG: hypothetical protein ABI863_16840 [Ginsengibacter sp.]
MGKLVIKHRTYYHFVLAGLVVFTLSAIGQGNSQKLNTIIILNDSKIRVDSLLNTFSTQTHIDFSFNSKKIDPAKVISVKNKKQTLAEWLSTLQHDMGIQYTLLGDHIILVDNPSPTRQKPVSKKITLKHVIKQTGGNVAINKPVAVNNNDLLQQHENQEAKPLPDSNETPTNHSDTEAVHLAANPVHDSLSINDSMRHAPVQPHDSAGTVMHENNVINKPAKSLKERQNIFESGKKTIVGIGAVISVPGSFSKGETSSALGVGLDIKLEKVFSKNFSGTLGLGYNYFTGNYTYYNYAGTTAGYAVGKNFANLPILAGLKYYFGRKLYVSGEAGMLIKASSNTGSHLAISPSAGYILPVAKKAIDVGIRLLYVKPGFGTPESTSLQNGGYSFWSLRIACLF